MAKKKIKAGDSWEWITRLPGLICLFGFPGLLFAQPKSIQVTSRVPLAVQLPQHAPMKAGQPLDCRLLYPVYVDNQLVIPAGSLVRGGIVRLEPDRSRRLHSRFRGDFTPFHIPVVQFNELVLPDGSKESIVSEPATHGIPILRLSPPPGRPRGGFLAQQWDLAKDKGREIGRFFTAPGRGDRLVQVFYHQLPYHPERIESATTWTVNLAQPADIKPSDSAPQADPVVSREQKGEEWQLHAYLEETLSSAKQKPGETFQAWISEPVFNTDHELVVPEGSLLVGEITKAKAARSFGRQGRLRFKFREIRLPGGFVEPVHANLTGIDSLKSANLQVDAEGEVQPQPRNRITAPLVLALLASRGFDQDDNKQLNGAVAANGFGIIGRVAGIVASSRNVAAGIGVYGAALSIFDLWLAPGKDVVFVKSTRIEVTTTPARSPLTTH